MGLRRKALGVAASLAGVALIVTGCSGNSSDGSPTVGSSGTGADTAPATIRVMLWGNDQDITSIKDAAKGFSTAHPEVTIEWETGDCAVDYAACKTLAAGGNLPDVFVPGTWTYFDAVRDGIVENLTPYLEKSGTSTSDFTPAVIKALTASDGNLYGLPMGYNIQSLFYNKDEFDAAGLSYPPADGSYTYDDVREWAKKLTLDKAGHDAGDPAFDPSQTQQWGYTNSISIPIPQGYMPVLAAFGGGILGGPNRDQCTADSPETIAGFQWLADLMWTDHTAITPQLGQEEAGGSRWVRGQVAMQFGSHEQVAAVQAQNPALNFGIAALPKGPAGNATLWQAQVWSMSAQSKAKDAAWEFVHYMSTDGAGKQMALIPAYKDLAQGEDFAQAPGEPTDLAAAQIEPASWPLAITNTDPTGVWGLVTSQDGIAPALDDIISGRKSASEALNGICASTIDALLQGTK